MPGFVPGIHAWHRLEPRFMDGRIKSGHDE
jgi:hypothetical protein